MVEKVVCTGAAAGDQVGSSAAIFCSTGQKPWLDFARIVAGPHIDFVGATTTGFTTFGAPNHHDLRHQPGKPGADNCFAGEQTGQLKLFR
jgi:hypothetical protein